MLFAALMVDINSDANICWRVYGSICANNWLIGSFDATLPPSGKGSTKFRHSDSGRDLLADALRSVASDCVLHCAGHICSKELLS